MRSRSLFFLLACAILLLAAVLLLAAPGTFVTSGWAAGPTWTDLQGPTGGPAQALALNPNYPADPIALAGGGRDFGYASWGGLGIFRSQDGGLTWPDRGGPSNGALLDVAFSPKWENDGYALAGLWQGLWSTGDRGASWQQLSSLETGGPAFIAAVAVAPPAGGARTLLAGGPYGGIHRSADAGATWSYHSGPASVRRLGFFPQAPSVALAATANGLWRTADGGLQWTQVTTPTQIFDVAIAADGATAYATFDSRIWQSSDTGFTWQPMEGLQVAFLDPIGLSHDGAGLFVAAGSRLFRYEPAFSTFVTVTTNLATSSFLRLAPSPDFAADRTLLAGTFDGVWISRDAGATFVQSGGFTRLPVTDVEPTTGDADGDLFAAGEYGIWRRSSGVWQPVNAGLMGVMAATISDMAVSPAYAQDQTLFAANVRTVGIGASLYKSTDRGATWRNLTNAASIGQIVLSPAFATDRRAYMVADQRIKVSTDAGETWSLQPFWNERHTARLLVLSPDFAADQKMVAVGDQVYLSDDAGATWQPAAAPPPIGGDDATPWRPLRLAMGSNDRLFLSIYRYAITAPYLRENQLWTSADGGATWTQLADAPDVPVAELAIGPAAGGGEVLYLSAFDDDVNGDPVIASDLYLSADLGTTWRNLGAVPGGAPAFGLTTLAAAPDQVLAGSRGVWRLASGQAPTATPDPCQELLRNRSFEYEGVWRIPSTSYSAAYSQVRHSHGWWSMRTGIVDPAGNRRSFSDFSQDVALPADTRMTLRFQRWPQGEATTAAGRAALGTQLTAATVDEFYSVLEAMAGDLQYAMVIEPPNGTIHFLYARLDNQQAWVEESFDLTPYAGKVVRLQFGTFNDGVGSVAAQYFDAFSLTACAVAPPPPTTTPATTPTASPGLWLPYVGRPAGGTIPPPASTTTVQ
jgi:photosystem II stability/assembly factor-like uncharacterized protein